MKTSNVLASVLFGAFAVAAPVNKAFGAIAAGGAANEKRAMVTHTATVVQTAMVYTTIYAGDAPVAPKPTTAAAPLVTTSVAKPSSAKPVSTPAKASSAAAIPKPISAAVPLQPSSKTSVAAVAPTSIKAPVPSASAAKPTTTAVAAKPTSAAAAAPSAPAAAPSAPAAAPAGNGEVHSGGSMTMNYFSGGTGACGKPIADTEMTVALDSVLWGASTYEVATGLPTNKWCNKSIAITYKGKTTTAKIMDRCPGCTNSGLDMTPALWQAVTGGAGGASGDRITGMTWTLA
jgi:hypothetical protein